jgi:two-component system sensor histidine kinase KdpD
LLAGLELLPMRQVGHSDRVLMEFDLDAALKRKPALILIDELAHSNVPGSRHPKRWQDVEELLGAGIDVWSTVNVQHRETLNDVVTGITGIRVWETVPDRVFDEADEVVIVDLPPDDLLQRLKEGKVYLPQRCRHAVRSFFRKGNLLALRELALRRTARPRRRRDAPVPAHPGGGAGVATREALLAVHRPDESRSRSWCVARRGGRAALTCRGTAFTSRRRARAAPARRSAPAVLRVLKLRRTPAPKRHAGGDAPPAAIVKYAHDHNLCARGARPRHRALAATVAQHAG